MNITAKEVKKMLKEHGFETKKIRVRVEHFGYGSMSINVKLMDVTLDYSAIDKLLRSTYQEIRQDEHVQGEYLEGCNMYVRCSYDEDVFEQAIEEMYPRAKKIYADLESQNTYNGKTIFENDKIKAVAFFKNKVITIMSKANKSGAYPKHLFHSCNDLAETLVLLENGQPFGAI